MVMIIVEWHKYNSIIVIEEIFRFKIEQKERICTKTKKRLKLDVLTFLLCRGTRIRTWDPLFPKQMR